MSDFIIKITVPDAEEEALKADFAAARGYLPTVFDNDRNVIPNPVDVDTFIRQSIGSQVFGEVISLRARRAANAAAEAATATAVALGAACSVS